MNDIEKSKEQITKELMEMRQRIAKLESADKQHKQIEISLREIADKYQRLYNSCLDGIASFDQEGNILDCNQGFANMLGYTKEELLQLTIFNIIPEKWHEMGMKILREQVRLRGYSDEIDTEIKKKDGTIIPVSIRAWVIFDKEGQTIGRWAVIRDITRSKETEEKLRKSEERYRGFYESSIDGIASTDMKGNIKDCNEAFADMFGYTKEELDSHPVPFQSKP